MKCSGSLQIKFVSKGIFITILDKISILSLLRAFVFVVDNLLILILKALFLLSNLEFFYVRLRGILRPYSWSCNTNNVLHLNV